MATTTELKNLRKSRILKRIDVHQAEAKAIRNSIKSLQEQLADLEYFILSDQIDLVAFDYEVNND